MAPITSMEVEEAPPPPVRRSLVPSMVEAFRRASRAAFLVGAEPLGGTSFGDGEETSTPRDDNIKGITRQEAWSNLVLALIGVVVCLLPNIMAQCGWLLCPPLLLLSALVIIRMGALICHACTLVEESNARPAGSLKNYEDLAKEIGMFKVVLVTKNTVMMALVLIAQQFMTGALEGLMPINVSMGILRWCVVMPMFCVMVLLKDLSQLRKFAWLGLLGLAVQLVGLLIGCFLGSIEAKPKKPRSYTMIPSDVYDKTGVTLAAFIFAFAILATVPSIRSQMRQPAEMPLALRDAILFTVVLYEVIMIWGYCVFGETVNENLTLEISKSFPFFGTLPSLGLFVNVSITTPLYFFCLCSVIESTGSDACRTQGTPINGMARLFFVLLLTAVGWSLPQILPIIGVFSSVFCVCNNFWFPIFFYHKLCKQVQQPVPTLGLIVNLAIAILGILVFVWGLDGSLKKLAKEMEWHKNVTTTATTTSATNSSNISVDLLMNAW